MQDLTPQPAALVDLANNDVYAYLEGEVGKMHPNAQRMYSPKLWAEVAKSIAYNKPLGLSFEQGLQRDGWDSLARWYGVAYEYMVTCARVHQENLACEGACSTCHCNA
jgi:hypothetical protein